MQTAHVNQLGAARTEQTGLGGVPHGLCARSSCQAGNGQCRVSLAFVANHGRHAANVAVGVNDGGDVTYACAALGKQRFGAHEAKGGGAEGLGGASISVAVCGASAHGASQLARLHLRLRAEGKQLRNNSRRTRFEGSGQFLILCSVLGAVKQHIHYFEVDAIRVKA